MMVWPERIICSMRLSFDEGPFDVFGVEGDVAAVEHGVLGDANVDKGQLHARQHVLDAAHVDVAVDLVGFVSGLGDRVLDHGASLEGGDVGRLFCGVHAHEVAALGSSTALSPAPALVLAPPGSAVGSGGLGC
jgi:hypothetical protein